MAEANTHNPKHDRKFIMMNSNCTKLAAIYTRVALEDNKHDTALKELRQYCKSIDWVIIEYKEKPRLVKVRPILDMLMHDARQKKFDVVVVWKLDRFAQSIRHLIETVTELDSYGIQFICTTEGIDTNHKSPMGAFLMQIMASFRGFRAIKHRGTRSCRGRKSEATRQTLSPAPASVRDWSSGRVAEEGLEPPADCRRTRDPGGDTRRGSAARTKSAFETEQEEVAQVPCGRCRSVGRVLKGQPFRTLAEISRNRSLLKSRTRKWLRVNECASRVGDEISAGCRKPGADERYPKPNQP